MALKYGAPDVDVVTFAFENKGGNQDKPVRDLSGAPYLLPRSNIVMPDSHRRERSLAFRHAADRSYDSPETRCRVQSGGTRAW